jgi:hypothetical protein
MRKPTLLASLAILALAPGAGGQLQAPAPGALVSKNFVGVYRLGPSGPVQKIVGPDIRPIAVAADGTALGFLASDRSRSGPLYLARGPIRIQLPQSAGGTNCAAFSADGSQVVYITGKVLLTRPSADLNYFRIEGTLWLADVAHPAQAHPIDSGTFTTSECPLAAPTGRRFAYFIQAAPLEWELRLYRSAGSAILADDETPVPSSHDRSFAWAPNGTLGFIRNDDLWVGQRRIATNLTATIGPQPNIRYARAVDFSSNGRLIAVSLAQRTGIFKLNGKLLRVVKGHLIDWSGSQGVLTIGVTKKFQIAFYRFPLRGAGRVLSYHFKLPAVSDPKGAWFAYPEAGRSQLIFRRADGSVLRVVQFTLLSVPIPLAAVDRSGRLSVPAGSY